jgi:hypothetical protein
MHGVSEASFKSLRDAEAALRLINAWRQERGEVALELAALDLARARTIVALNALVHDTALWAVLAQHQEPPDDRGTAVLAVTEAVTGLLVRVGHVPPPPVAEILSIALGSLDAVPDDEEISSTDLVTATRAGLLHLRAALNALSDKKPTSTDRLRETLDTAGDVLLHVATAGEVAARNQPRWARALLGLVTALTWGVTGNLATDLVKHEPQDVPARPPAAVAPATPGPTLAAPQSDNPFRALRDMNVGPQKLDAARLRNLREDLLDDIAGSDRWSPDYRLVRLEQLVKAGAVPAAEAETVREELLRQKANEARPRRASGSPSSRV